MMPSTPEVFKRTKRIQFARRMTLMDRPLLIIQFQGVLGDFVKKTNQGMREIGAKKQDKKEQTTEQVNQPFGGL